MPRFRVLFLATRDWQNPGAAGGDINMWECARYLAYRGHVVTYLATTFPKAQREETIDGVRVVRLGGIFSLWATTFLHYIRYCRGRYDIVITEGFGGSRIPRLAPLYVKGPILTEWRQVHRDLFAAQYPRLALPFLNLLERLTAYVHRDTTVLAYTPEGADEFASIGFRREQIVVVPVSIRGEWLDDQRIGQVATPTIIWLGKFRRYKCCHHVLLAMPEILKQVPGASLILAGRRDDRRYENQLRLLVDQLGLAGTVQFRFNLTEPEKRGLLEGSRVLVLPSAVEGYGIVVLEANARGVPVVASGGVPSSAVRHEDNGLRYPFGNVTALASGIVRVLQDDALYRRLSARAVEAASSFRWASVGLRYEAALQALLETHSKPYQAEPVLNEANHSASGQVETADEG